MLDIFQKESQECIAFFIFSRENSSYEIRKNMQGGTSAALLEHLQSHMQALDFDRKILTPESFNVFRIKDDYPGVSPLDAKRGGFSPKK